MLQTIEFYTVYTKTRKIIRISSEDLRKEVKMEAEEI